MNFGESLFAGDHVCIRRKAVLKEREKYIQSINCKHENWRVHILKKICPESQEAHLQPIKGCHMDSRVTNMRKPPTMYTLGNPPGNVPDKR